MVPFADLMYDDAISVRRVFSAMQGGRKVVDYLAAEAPIAASVQPATINRLEPNSGRLTTVSMYSVRTPFNPLVKTEDIAVWVDGSGVSHELTAVGPSIARGIGDVEYSTEFVETV